MYFQIDFGLESHANSCTLYRFPHLNHTLMHTHRWAFKLIIINFVFLFFITASFLVWLFFRFHQNQAKKTEQQTGRLWISSYLPTQRKPAVACLMLIAVIFHFLPLDELCLLCQSSCCYFIVHHKKVQNSTSINAFLSETF